MHWPVSIDWDKRMHFMRGMNQDTAFEFFCYLNEGFHYPNDGDSSPFGCFRSWRWGDYPCPTPPK